MHIVEREIARHKPKTFVQARTSIFECLKRNGGSHTQSRKLPIFMKKDLVKLARPILHSWKKSTLY